MKSVLRHLLRHASTFLLLLAFCLLGVNAHAAGVYTVTNLSDSGLGSLRTAIGNANAAPGSTVNFQTGLSGTIPLQSALPDILVSMTIQGPGANIIAVDGGHSPTNLGGYRIFHMPYNQSTTDLVTISGLTIQNGFRGTPVTSNDGGAGMCNSNGGTTLAVTNCVFNGNVAGNYAVNQGGGALANYGVLSVINCVFSANTASGGGGVLSEWGNNGSIIARLTNCSMTGNSGQAGGAIIAGEYSRVILTNDILYGDGAGTLGSNEISNNASSPINAIPAVTGTYCDVQGGIGPDDGTNHNLNADPLFVRVPNLSGTFPDYGDLHLRPLSPCIGAGTSSAPAYSPTDLDGNTRNNPPSIGAYEAHSLLAGIFGISVGGDGLTRMLWDNPNGSASLRRVNADASVTTGTYGPYVDAGGTWQAVAVATGPNNVSRILWTSSDGRAVLWYVNSDGSHGDGGQYGPYSDSGGIWRATTVSVGPDSLPHLLWINPDGRSVIWNGNANGTYSDHGQYGPFNDSGGTWKAASLATGPNNVSRLLWTSPDARAVLWYVSPDGSHGTSQIYGPYTDTSGIWRAVTVAVGPDSLPHLLWNSSDGRAVIWNGNADGTYSNHGQYGPFNDSDGTRRAIGLAMSPNGTSQLLWVSPGGLATLWSINTSGIYRVLGTYGRYMN